MSFKVGVTSDILDAKGEPVFGREPLKAFEVPGLALEWLPKGIREITAEHAAKYDALYVNSPKVPAAAVAGKDLRLKVVSRHGVGYDSVDVPAMSAAGVLVCNTPNAVPRPVATMALTFVLALAQKMFAKDRMTREGRWNDRVEHMGMGLTGRTLGVVGAGRIGKELLRMAKVFDLKLLAADPYAEELELSYIGARKVPLETLMAESSRGRMVRGYAGVTLHQGDGLGKSVELYQKNPGLRTLVFIDGDHSYESVYRELNGVIEAMPNAHILLHDTFYQSEAAGYNIGPYRAVTETLEKIPGQFRVMATNTGLPGMTLLYKL